MKSNVRWAEAIFLAMGFLVYLGFWAPVIISANLNSLAGIAAILVFCAALGGLYYLIAYAVMKVHQKLLVPLLRKVGVYEHFVKYDLAYALFLSIPAVYLGFLNTLMTYGCPGGHPEFNVFSAMFLYVYGWFAGATSGAVMALLTIPMVDLFVAGWKKLSTSNHIKGLEIPLLCRGLIQPGESPFTMFSNVSCRLLSVRLFRVFYAYATIASYFTSVPHHMNIEIG